MTASYSISETFTLTNAKHLASKVVADLYQCHRFYGAPAESSIAHYHDELVVMLAGGYVEDYEFGFKKDGQRVVSWQYRISAGGDLVGGSDARSGGIYARAQITGAEWFNFMNYTATWWALTDTERSSVRGQHPVRRSTGTLPADGAGYWETDRSYNSGGVQASRRSFRPL